MLLCVLLHDRGALAAECLTSLHSMPGADFQLALHYDAASDEVYDLTAAWRPTASYVSRHVGEPAGAAVGMNRLLAERRSGEHVCRVDSDTIVHTSGWLRLLQDDLEEFGAKAPAIADMGEDRYHYREVTASGIVLYNGRAMNELGGFVSYGSYGAEDLDYAARLKAADWRAAYDNQVRVTTAPSTAIDRRDQLDDALRLFKKNEALYVRGERLTVGV